MKDYSMERADHASGVHSQPGAKLRVGDGTAVAV